MAELVEPGDVRWQNALRDHRRAKYSTLFEMMMDTGLRLEWLHEVENGNPHLSTVRRYQYALKIETERKVESK